MADAMNARRFLLFSLFLTLLSFLGSCAEPLQPQLEVTPTSRALVSGDVVSLTVTRRFPGGAVEDVTSKVAYLTSDRRLAVVDGNGVLTAGQDPGSVQVRVIDPASDATTVATFTINPSKIDTIDITPSPAVVLTIGQSRQFTALAHYTNGTTKDVTGQVLWSSSNVAAASVNEKGFVSAVAAGDTNIVATDNATLVQGRTIVFVTGGAPQLKAILVTPNPAVVQATKTLQFSALGVLSDGSTTDITAQVKWSSSRTDLATIDAAGLLTGVAAGDTTVTATGPEPSSSVKGSAAAKVTP